MDYGNIKKSVTQQNKKFGLFTMLLSTFYPNRGGGLRGFTPVFSHTPLPPPRCYHSIQSCHSSKYLSRSRPYHTQLR
jgi:hypothetical protein